MFWKQLPTLLAVCSFSGCLIVFTCLSLWSWRIDVAICFMSYLMLFLCFSVLLALRLPRLGKRELILVFFVPLFDLCLFGFDFFLFLLVSGKGCGL